MVCAQDDSGDSSPLRVTRTNAAPPAATDGVLTGGLKNNQLISNAHVDKCHFITDNTKDQTWTCFWLEKQVSTPNGEK